MKRFYGYRQVKEAMGRYERYGQPVVKEQIINISLANNFVNQFTSLFVKLPQTPPAVTLPTSRSSGSTQKPTLPGTLGSGFALNTKTDQGRPGTTNAPTQKLFLKDVPDVVSKEDPNRCEIILYSDYMLVGDSRAFTESVPDLTPWNFNDRLESLEVRGNCSWKIFEGKDYTGEGVTFGPGIYDDFDQLGGMYNLCMSVKLLTV